MKTNNALHTVLIYLLTIWSAMFLVHYAVALDAPMTTDTFLENLNDRDNTDLLLQKRPSFFVGSRYGRAGGTDAASKKRRLNVMPRNDRFFLGSRYGKRSGEYPTPIMYDQDTNDAADDYNSNNKSNKNKLNLMSCLYTGIKNLYRCKQIDEINTIFNQLNGQADDEEPQQQQQQQQHQ